MVLTESLNDPPSNDCPTFILPLHCHGALFKLASQPNPATEFKRRFFDSGAIPLGSLAYTTAELHEWPRVYNPSSCLTLSTQRCKATITGNTACILEVP